MCWGRGWQRCQFVKVADTSWFVSLTCLSCALPCPFPPPPHPQALPLMPSPWFVLGAELLQGATFALVGSIHPLCAATHPACGLSNLSNSIPGQPC